LELVIIKQPRVIPRQVLYQVAKRSLDLALSIWILPVAIPIMLVCAIAIYLDSPGPVLFIQERIGKGGKFFKMYKFRTMRTNLDDLHCRTFMKAYVKGEIDCNEEGEKIFKPVKAQEIFRVGRILRKTSLDELPQLINVFRGEMSIVGPRPNVPYEVEAYRPWHYERLEVLPGITGLAQVHGRSCIDFATIVRHDIQYIENQSLALDLKILWWTFLSGFTGEGAK